MLRAIERTIAWLRERPALVVGLAAGLTQVNTLWNQPVLDDGWVIFDNPLVKSLANVPRIFTEGYNVAGAATNAGLWRPVTTLTYALNYAAGGMAVGGYHAVNAGLHVAVSLLVLAWARHVVASVAPARAGTASLLAALLFAVHPVHVEAVAGMVGRAELLAALFSLAALYLSCTLARGRFRLPGALAATFLGVLSKENAAVVPLLYLLVAVTVPAAAGLPSRPGPASGAPRTAVRRALGVAALLAAAAALPFLLRPGRGLGVPVEAAWFGARPAAVVAGTMFRAVAEYLRLLVFPLELGADFFYATRIPFTPALAPEALRAAAMWSAVLLLGVLSIRRAPVRALGILWVFAALLPVLNIVPAGVLMAERLLYLPSVGFCLWAGHGAAWSMEAIGRRLPAGSRVPLALRVAAACALVALSARTLVRNGDWRDGRSLWEAEVTHAPLDPVVNNNLAVALTQAGEYERARERVLLAIRVAPGYWLAWVNLGIVQQRTGDLRGALRSFAEAVRIAPGEPRPRFYRGLALADAGDLQAAADALLEAEILAPEDAETRFRRGGYLLRLGRIGEARSELARATALDPWHGEARALLSKAEATPP